MSTSIFATASTPLADVAEIVDHLDRFVTSDGIIITKALEGVSIKYSRAWLIARRAWLEANQPKLLVTPTKAAVDKAEKTFSATDPKWMERHVLGPIALKLRLEGHSWGEIAVRMGISESLVRKAFVLAPKDAPMKDVGLRIGKGGRFVADRPDLYTDNRKAEGAEIPDAKGVYASTVEVSKLLNFVPAEANA